MFEVILQSFGKVIGFIGHKIMTIQILNINLLSWICTIAIITIVVKLVMDNSFKFSMNGKVSNKIKEEKDE